MGRSASAGVEVFADLRADVGEAPHWDGRTRTLLFVDLTGGMVFRYGQSGVRLGSFSVGQEVGAVIPRRGGGLVLAVRDGIAVATESGQDLEVAAPVERDILGNRMNDAKCDPAGRLLAGTMAFDASLHSAALYVTSAAYRRSADQLKKEPHAGATFICRPGAEGMPASSFAG